MAVSLEHERALGGAVMGIDEAGRGPLVGGVYAAAVHVPLDRAAELLADAWRGINDSKKLSERKRDALAEIIKTTPDCTWAIASASPAEIDKFNILKATHLAMRRAAESIAEQLVGRLELVGRGVLAEPPFRNRAIQLAGRGILAELPGDRLRILVDGLPVPSLPFPSRNLVKGDAKSLLIAAASILAKTARDADCLRLEATYPGYGFAQHKGYPTKVHLEALARLGPCPEHRRSFGPVSQMELGL